jgi:hypothetical protein
VNRDLEGAIRAVQALAGRPASLTRHEARPILLLIGGSLLAGKQAEVGNAAELLRALPGPLGESWVAAVRDEWSMAFTEYVRSVDPRYLKHPQYDLAYTLEARLQLEARWRASLYLGIPPDKASTAAVERADTLLGGRAGTGIREWLSKQGEKASS